MIEIGRGRPRLKERTIIKKFVEIIQETYRKMCGIFVDSKMNSSRLVCVLLFVP